MGLDIKRSANGRLSFGNRLSKRSAVTIAVALVFALAFVYCSTIMVEKLLQVYVKKSVPAQPIIVQTRDFSENEQLRAAFAQQAKEISQLKMQLAGQGRVADKCE